MEIIKTVLISVVSVFGLGILFFYIKSRRPLRSAAINALSGILALVLVNLTSKFTGVHIPVNIYTVPSSFVFGIPAVCALIIFQTIIM